MDFINWWFDTHYLWSTLLTPAMTIAWCCFKGDMVWRMIVAIFLYLAYNSRWDR